MTGNPHVLIISASFGAGHDRAADQLAWRLQAAGWPIRQLDLLNLLPAGLGPALRRGYHTQLRLAPASWDWALSVAASPRVGAGVNRLVALATARLQEHVSAGTAAAVSTYPLTSQLLGAMRTNGALPVPAVTYLTDMSVHPLWIAPGIDAHLAIHPIPAEQARTHGARTVHVIDPLVGPTFRPALTAAEKAAARAQFDLPHRGPLALVATGSWGVGQFETTATDIAASGLATPVIACATNHTARRRLTARRIGIPLGWTHDMPTLMRACDLVVQSGGGMSSLEARATGLPVITYQPLPGHGRASAHALHHAGWATWARTRQGLAHAITTALTAVAPTVHNRPAANAIQIISRLITPTSTTAAVPA